MKRFLSFFVPHRLDGIALILLLLMLPLVWAVESVDVFAPWNEKESDNLTVIAVFSWACIGFLAVGVATGWGRCSHWISIPLLACCVAACIACYFVFDKFEVDKTSYALWYGDIGSTRRLAPPIKSYFLHMIWALPASLIGGFLFVLAFRKLPRLFSTTNAERFNLSRQKFLVIAACCLFVIAMGSRAVGSFQGGYGPSASEFVPLLLLNLAIAAASFIVLVILPSWILLVNENFVWKVVLAIVAALLTGFAIWQANFYVQNTRWGIEVAAQLGISVAGGLIFLLALIGLKRHRDSAEQAERQNRLFPTIWTMVIFAAAVGASSLIWYFESTILVADPFDSFAWRRARMAKKYLAPSGSKFTSKPFPQAVNIWNFSDTVDQDVLKHFDEINDGRFSLLVNLNTEIDTAPIANVAKQLALQDCSINGKQLADLWKNAGGFVSYSNVELVDPPAKKITAPSVTGLMIVGEHAGQIAKLVDPIVDNNFRMQILSELHAEDFASVAQAAQNSLVFLNGGMDLDTPVPVGNPSLANISLYLNVANYSQLIEALRHPILLETDIGITIQRGIEYTAQEYWDLYFATSGRISMGYGGAVDEALEELDFDQACRRFHWGFGFNDNDEVTELFLPESMSTSIPANPTQIKTLSFDSSWLFNRKTGFWLGGNTTKLDHLASLTNLEKLFLSKYLCPESLDFLVPMQSLKHLQIREPKRPLMGSSGFDMCASLESLTIFDLPTPQTLTELAQLPRLQKLTIVDLQNQVSDTKKRIGKLKKILPNCDVAIVKLGDHLDAVPQSFLDHKERIGVRTRKKLFSENE